MDKESAQVFELENQVDEKTVHELLQRQILDQGRKVHQVYFIFSSIISTSLIIAALGIVLTLITTLFFILFPEESANLISSTDRPTRVVMAATAQFPAVLGVSTEKETGRNSVSFLGLLFKPVTSLSLQIVKQIDNEKYTEIVGQQAETIEYLYSNGQTVVVNGKMQNRIVLTNPQSIQFTEPELIKNFNAEYLDGKSYGTNPGDLVAFSDENTVPTLRLTIENFENLKLTGSSLANNSIVEQNIFDGAITTDKIADGAITLAKLAEGVILSLDEDSVTTEIIKNGEVKEADLDNASVTSDKIRDGTISANDLASTLQLSSSGFIDLSLITHNTNSLQGLRLPQVSSTPTAPASGKGFVAFDKDNNQVVVYNGSSWTPVGSGDITAITAGNGLTGSVSTGDATIDVLLTTSGTTGLASSNSGLEVSSAGLTLLKGCNDNQILKYTDAGGWQCANDLSSGGGSATLQDVYSNATNPEIVLSASPGGITIRDAASAIAGNLFEIQNNAGGTNYLAVSTTGISVTGSGVFSNGLTVSAGSVSLPAGQVDNSELANSSLTITTSTGLSGGGLVSLGGSLSISLDQGVSPTWTSAHTFQGNVIISDAGADTITLGNSTDTLSIASTGLNVTSAGTITGATISTASNTISGLSDANFTSTNISQWSNNAGYLTTVDISANTNLSASDGITLTGDALTNSDKGSSQSIFKSIAVSGQSDVVSDQNADTLTFVAGSNITITTDATGDTVTINATGAGGAYFAGNDLDVSTNTFSIEDTLDFVSTINLAGTGTLNGLDAIDSTSETTIEAAIDTLSNLTSASSLATIGTITSGIWNGTAIGDTYVANDLTISNTGTVDFTALSNYPSACGAGTAITTLGDTPTCTAFVTAEADTLNTVTGRGATTANAITITTAGAALLLKPGSAPAANTVIFDLQQTGGGSTVFSVDYEGDVVANSLTVSTALTDAQISDTLTASIFLGSGSTTNAVDLATAEVAGTLGDGNVSDTLTIGAASTISASALPADGYAATYVNVGESPISSDIGGSFSGGLTIGADRVTEAMLKAVDSANDEECLTYETTTGDFEWQSCGGSSLTPWTSDIDADGYDLNDLSNILFRETTGAPAGTDVGLFRDNTGDLTANVLTGKTFNISVNGSDEYNFSSTAFSLNSNSIDTGSATLSTAELNLLDGKTTLVDVDDAVSTAITGTGTLTAGSTGAGFTLNFGSSTLSGNITGTNIDESSLAGLTTSNFTSAAVSQWTNDSGYITDGNTNWDNSYGFLTSVDVSSNTNLSATNGIILTGDALSLDLSYAPTWTSAHTFTLADAEDLQIDIGITGTNAGQGILTTVTNSSASGNQYGIYIDNAESSGTTESLLVIDNSDSDTAVTNAIQFVNAGGGFTNLFDVAGTTISSAEFTILDGGITLAEISDSGTFTAGTVDINGGSIDGTAIGANSASSGAFTTLSSTGVTTIGNNSATVAINSSDWDIDNTGAMTGLSFDANGSGNSISNIDNADLTNDTLNFDKISATLTLDEETTISAGGALNFLIGNNVTLTTSGTGAIIATNLVAGSAVVSNAEVDDDLTISSSGSVTWSALTSYPTGCSGGEAVTTIGDTLTCGTFLTAEADTLNSVTGRGATTANGISLTTAGTALLFKPGSAPAANTLILDLQQTGGGSTVFSVDYEGDIVANSLDLATALSDAEISDTLTASIFVGSGSTTDAIDLATAEVAGTLADGNISDTLTIGAASTIAAGALPADGYAATYVNIGESPTASDIGGSFSGGLTIGADRVTEAMLKAVDSANDEECLTFETTTGDFEWQTCGGSSLTPWTSDIDADGYDLNDLSNILFRETAGAPAGTDVGLFRDNTGDLTANVLTGKTFNISVNGSDEYNFSSSEFALNSNSINTGSTTLSTAELDRLDGVNAALVDTNDAVATAITGTGTLTAGATGAGFTLNFGTSTLSGNIGGGNIDESTLSGIDISGSTNLTASNGVALTGDALSLDVSFGPTWTSAHTFNLAETEDLQIDIAISGTNAGQGLLTTLTNSSASGNQYGIYVDNATSTGTTEALLVLDNSDADTAVTNGIQFINAGGGITNLFDVFGTLISSSEFTVLDSGIAVSELTDSGTFTAGTVDINGGAIDGTAIGANAASSGAFTTLSSTGVTTIGNNSATVAINSSDWDIDNTGAMTGLSFDANGSGNSISNIDNADLTNDTLDFDKMSASLTLDEETTIAAGGALNLLVGNNVTLTTTGTGSIIATDLNCTNCINATEISDLALGTDTSGNYVTSVATGTGLTGGAAGSEGATLSLAIDQATAFTWTGQQTWTSTITAAGSIADINLTLGDDGDADIVSGLTLDITSAATGDADNLYALNIGNITAQANVLEYAIRIGSGWQEIFDINGTLLSATELGLLDGKTTLVDTDDAVATAITGVGTITAGTWNGDALTDAYVSNTLTASIFVGSGSTTDAIDLATAEVAGTLADGNISDTLTIGAASTIAAGALPADGYAATYVNVGESPTASDIGGSFSGGLTIGNDRVVEAMLDAVDTANDEECLTYEETDDDFEWQSCGTGLDLDAVYDTDSDKVLGIDSVTGLIFNMTTTGNLVIQDNGNAIATFANDGIITFDPGATAAGSDFIISQRSGTNTQLTAAAAPTVDMLVLSNAGQGITTTSGVDAFSLTYVQATDGTAITGSAIDINLTQSTDASDTIRGITLNNITNGASTEEGLYIGTGFDRALMIEGGTAGSGLVEIGSDQTTGTIFELGAPSSTTLSGTLTAASIDLSTNYTITDQSLKGIDLLLAGGTNTAGTVTLEAIEISGTAIVQTVGGSTTFSGIDVTTPAITQTAGTVSAYGLNVVTGNITTQGTQAGVNIDLSSSDIATNGTLHGLNIAGRSSETVGTINGINIGNITAGTATERGVSIGSGWDANLIFLDTTTQIQISDGGAFTFEDLSGNDSLIIRDVSAVTDHVITIDSDTQFTFDSANDTDVDITTNTNEALRIQANGSGDIIFEGDSDSDFQITDGTNSYTFNVISGPVYAGTARPAKRVTLSPEYLGAVLTSYYGAGTDTDTTGNMTSDTDTSQGTSIRNYYQWERTTDATQHFYTVAVRVTLPKDFSAWATSNALQISYQTESATNTESDLDVRVYNENDATVVGSSTDNASTSWTTVTIDDSTLDDGAGSEWDAADETVVIYLRMGSGNSQYVRVGDIVLNYLAQF